jgi:hypothetical protein
MASLSYYDEYDGKIIDWSSLRDIFDDALNNYDTDYTYWSVLVKNFRGKNIEITITDIKKDKIYKEKGVVK